MKRDWPLLAALTMTGLAALALEVLWSRAMIPWVGGTALSQITTVGIYMAGLFVGSALAVPRLARVADPRAAFFRAELAAALLSLLAVIGMPAADPLFALFSQGDLLGSAAGSVLRGLAGAGLMIPATILMGYSFPLAIAAFEASQGGRGNAALAYGVNTVGATLGTLLGGFVLVPRFGVTQGALIAVAADVVALLLLMRLPAPRALPSGSTRRAPATAAAGAAPAGSLAPPPAVAPSEWPMLLSIFVGGMVSLGLQAVLFRVLGLLLGPTARAFTVVLAVYVGGLGLGSLLAKRVVERGPAVASRLYLACWWIVGLWGLFVLMRVEALTGLVAGRRSGGVEYSLADQLQLRAWIATVVLLPITAAFGASYSAAVAAAPTGDARRASRLYAALTLGNIVGLGVVAWGVLPSFRLDRALLLVLAVALVTPLPALVALPIGRGARVITAGAGVVAAFAAWFLLPGWPQKVLHTAAYIPGYAAGAPRQSKEVVRYHRSAFETSVTVVQVGEDLFLQLDGKTTGSTDVDDQATQALLGALPAALHPDPKRAFVIGLGTGQTPAEVLRHPVLRVDCAEISPEVVDVMGLFAPVNRRCDLDPRFRMLEADGRTVLRYGGEQYDLVISEPSNVWIPGVAHLFTRESFEDVHGCLDPQDGLCVQWVQGYGMQTETLRTIVRTFLHVFPHASLWFSSFAQPDICLVGSMAPYALDFAALERRLTAAQVPDPSSGGRPFDAVELLRHFVAGPETLRRFVGEGPLTTDARPSLEYAAEEGLIGASESVGTNLIANLSEPPFALFADGGAALPAALRSQLARRADANRELVVRLADTARAAALLTSRGLAECEALLARFPDDRALRHALVGTLMFNFSMQLQEKAGDDAEVLGLMGRTARLDPDHAESLKFEAIRRLPAQQVDAVLALMDRHAAALEPWRQMPRVDRARCLAALNRLPAAIAELEAVVARDPWFYSAWRELEKLAMAAGRPELAAKARTRLAELADEGRTRASQERLAAEMAAQAEQAKPPAAKPAGAAQH
ncbi:MAG: fused MFS/spermidine synthase [Planctomycetes bacterium]|nr:fused MFS/spermidine synthase [Planctomycetota bacterium]